MLITFLQVLQRVPFLLLKAEVVCSNYSHRSKNRFPQQSICLAVQTTQRGRHGHCLTKGGSNRAEITAIWQRNNLISMVRSEDILANECTKLILDVDQNWKAIYGKPRTMKLRVPQ